LNEKGRQILDSIQGKTIRKKNAALAEKGNTFSERDVEHERPRIWKNVPARERRWFLLPERFNIEMEEKREEAGS